MDPMEYEQIEEEHKKTIRQVLLYFWLLWGLAFITIPTLIAMSIIHAKFRQEVVRPGYSPVMLIALFSAVAISSQFAAVALRNRFLSGKMNNFLKLCIRSGGNKEPDFETLCIFGLFLPAVVSSVPASMGAILLTMCVSPWPFYIFVALGALGMIYHRPQKDLIVEYIINEQKEPVAS